MKLAVVRVVQRLVIVMIQVKFKQWLPHNSWWVEKSGYCERGISTRCMDTKFTNVACVNHISHSL